MRVLYIDIDTLRPDHLGCYGYQRNTSPNIDAIAGRGVRFDQCYVSDAPCLPSRAALWTGRAGFHTGVVGHGGTAADPFIEGAHRDFQDGFSRNGWMWALRSCGLRTVTISPFAERHGAWFWYAGYNEVVNPGFRGMELADQVAPYALDWIDRNARSDNWFLHVNFWDPHTPYRTPASYGDPFSTEELPGWLTEELRRGFWDGCGPRSAQEPHHDSLDDAAIDELLRKYPRMPRQLDSMEAVRRWIDGYDTGIRYADDQVGTLLNALADAGVLDETIIVVSSDHGENQGELNVWGDHQTADDITCHVPLIVSWPGTAPRADSALHYHFDWAATLIELLGGRVPDGWDGRPFTSAFRAGVDEGRAFLVCSQAAWTCQRMVRFDFDDQPWQCIRTYHDGYKALPPIQLFNLATDPHEEHDLADECPRVTDHGLRLLTDWQYEMMLTSKSDIDPIATVLREGGPFHVRGTLPAYLNHLEKTGRSRLAEELRKSHAGDLKWRDK